MTPRPRPVGSLLALIVIAACGAAEQPRTEDATSVAMDAALEAELAAIRDVTTRFADPEAALAAGYMADPTGMCITAEMEGFPPEDGAMGVHYFRPDLLGITAIEPRVAGMGTHTDFNEPGVLVYAPNAAGQLELAAVENLVFVAGWEAAGHSAPPSFHGIEYELMVNDPNTEVDEAHGFEPHYELHLWVHKENPRGVATPFNPAVSCAGHAHPEM
jgi:hypothetical protein